MGKSKAAGGELSSAKRRVFGALAFVDVGMKAWALTDLAARPQSQVKGPKAAWAIALTVVNSVGLLPAAYLLFARDIQQ